MSTRTSATPSAASLEAALLARLGLPASASAQDVEAAHDGLVDFLDTAPAELGDWARAQVAAIDEAYALLSDPTMDRGPLSTGVEERTVVAAKSSTSIPGPASLPLTRGNRTIRRLALGAAAVVGVVAIAVAGFNMNGGTGVPPMNGSPAPEAAATPAVDQAVVGQLMEKLQANPNDVTTLQSLADAYYTANDFATAQGFLEKIIAVDSKNVTALLALGATRYNQGDATTAEKDWQQVVAIDDKNQDAHYYLGFMYLTQEPAQTEKARAEWAKVIAIDPTSDVAKTAAQHMNNFASAAPDTTAAPSGAPAPSPTGPAASTAPATPAASAPSGD